MANANGSAWKRFWAYVGYGAAACLLLAIPLVAIDWLLKNLPFLPQLVAYVQGFENAAVTAVVGLVVGLLFLALLGWILRRHLWSAVTNAPVIGTLVTSGQQFAHAMGALDHSRRDLVVWVQLLRYRQLGVVVSRTTDADGTEYASVFVLAGAGQFQGNQIWSVKADKLIYPGWTVDDAVVYSSSGGAVVPQAGEAPAGDA